MKDKGKEPGHIEVRTIDELQVLDAPKWVIISLQFLVYTNPKHVWIGINDEIHIGNKDTIIYKVVEWIPHQGLRCVRASPR